MGVARDRFSGRIVQVIAFALLPLSCASPPAEENPDLLRELLLREVDSAISSSRPFSVYPELNGGGFLSEDEVDAAVGGIVDRAVELFQIAAADEEWEEAARLRTSLDHLGGVSPSATERVPADLPSLDEIMAHRIDSALAEAQESLALLWMTGLPDLAVLDGETLDALSEAVLSTHNSEAAERLSGEYARRERVPDPALADVVGHTGTIAGAVESVVTVWVNRGMRVQGGLGYPDRVVGSGFFIGKDGFILTNHHIISSEVDPEYEGFSRLFVMLSDDPNRRIPARVVGYDRVFDLALLKIEQDAPGIVSAPTHVAIEPGERVIAVGSPGGLDRTVSSGIVSAVGRRFLQMGDAVQVDVPVNPGNSGGPLLNDAGELVGVIFAGVEEFEGVNFAIPSTWVHAVTPKLYGGDEVAHAWIGVSVSEEPDSLVVRYIVPGSPAAAAGLSVGSRIDAIEGLPVSTIVEAQAVLLDHPVDALLSLSVTPSDGGARDISVYAESRPYRPLAEAVSQAKPASLSVPLFGMDVAAVDERRGEYTVALVIPGSIADETGISRDDPLTIRRWDVDLESGFAFLQVIIRRRKAGFVESGIQLIAPIEVNTIL